MLCVCLTLMVCMHASYYGELKTQTLSTHLRGEYCSAALVTNNSQRTLREKKKEKKKWYESTAGKAVLSVLNVTSRFKPIRVLFALFSLVCVTI